ncbi:MAG TPA: serine--tRNA ligase, partial [Chitinophagales bacterium]|nr:serine--tRNA ligase [Chitinophagales bacterium]
MLEIAAIRANAEDIKQRLAKKHFKELNLIDEILGVDEKRRATQTKLDENLARQNAIAKEIGDLFKQGKKEDAEAKKAETVKLKEDSKQYEADLAKAEEEMKDILVRIPNVPHASVPQGRTPEENEVVKTVGEIPKLHEGAL